MISEKALEMAPTTGVQSAHLQCAICDTQSGKELQSVEDEGVRERERRRPWRVVRDESPPLEGRSSNGEAQDGIPTPTPAPRLLLRSVDSE